MAEFNWFPGHMNKTLKEIEKKIPVVDLVIEVVDARAPFSSQNPTFRKLLKDKPVLYVISKNDLSDIEVTKQWVSFFTDHNNTVLVLEPNNRSIVDPLINAINKATKAKQDKDKAKGMVRSLINVLVIGIPNVGKSTFINRLVKDKKVKVGNKPGVTRGIQSLSLNESITLMDTPGVLPAKLLNESVATNICAINSIKEEVYPKERVAARLMKYVFNNYEGLIEDKYKLPVTLKRPIEVTDSYNVFEMIAKSYGWYVADEMADVERVMTQFIRDLSNGKVGRISFERPSDIVPDDFDEEPVKTIDGDITTLWK